MPDISGAATSTISIVSILRLRMNGGFKTTADDAKIYDIDECLSPVSGKVDPWVRTYPQNRERRLTATAALVRNLTEFHIVQSSLSS